MLCSTLEDCRLSSTRVSTLSVRLSSVATWPRRGPQGLQLKEKNQKLGGLRCKDLPNGGDDIVISRATLLSLRLRDS